MKAAQPTIVLDASPLHRFDVERVAHGNAQVRLAPGAIERMRGARGVVERCLADGQAHYGINTGFGSLSRTRVDHGHLAQLQRNLVRSHAAGVGEALPVPIVRATMLVLAASLARGLSGVRPEVVSLIAECLNHSITPVVPSIGSVGASGDLAPLAHIALAFIGEGTAHVGDRDIPAATALRDAGLAPLTLQAKEGLALINGTHLMCARGSLVTLRAERLCAAATVACAMSIDASRATDAFLDARVHDARRQSGQIAVARALRDLLEGSRIIPSHRENDPRVQDPYSTRCAPVILGAALDACRFAAGAVDRELGAVTDNPLVFADGSVVSAGNFHGMPLAIPLDTLAIAASHIAGVSERRSFAMLAAGDPQSGLTPYLAPTPGLQSGLMIAQYTAAACCNEIIGLATPASVANIGTSAGMEDYNSFGPRAAAKADRALDLTSRVIAVELLCAAEAIERHRPLRSGHRVERALARVRDRVAPLTDDRPLTDDIERLAFLAESGLSDLVSLD